MPWAVVAVTRRPARRLLVLAALLLFLSWQLAAHVGENRPLLSLALCVAFCGAWVAGFTGAARVLAVERSA